MRACAKKTAARKLCVRAYVRACLRVYVRAQKKLLRANCACVPACVCAKAVRACVRAPESKSQFFSRTHYSSMHHDVGKYIFVGGGGAHRGFGVISLIIIVMAV